MTVFLKINERARTWVASGLALAAAALLPDLAFAAGGATASATSPFSGLATFLDGQIVGTVGTVVAIAALAIGGISAASANAIKPLLPGAGVAVGMGFGPDIISGLLSAVV